VDPLHDRAPSHDGDQGGYQGGEYVRCAFQVSSFRLQKYQNCRDANLRLYNFDVLCSFIPNQIAFCVGDSNEQGGNV
jgi:hypothetical protein